MQHFYQAKSDAGLNGSPRTHQSTATNTQNTLIHDCGLRNRRSSLVFSWNYLTDLNYMNFFQLVWYSRNRFLEVPQFPGSDRGFVELGEIFFHFISGTENFRKMRKSFCPALPILSHFTRDLNFLIASSNYSSTLNRQPKFAANRGSSRKNFYRLFKTRVFLD